MRDEERIEELVQEIELLRSRLGELEAKQAFHFRLEQELGHRTEELERRIREANCLYEVSRLVAEKGISLDEIMQKATNALSSSLAHAKDRQVRVTIGNQVFDSEAPNRAGAKLCYAVRTHSIPIGILEVFYDKWPLEPEEKKLARAVCSLLARIIEQKQTEKTLLENERSFRTLVEDSPTGILIVQNGRVVYENPEEKRLSGPVAHLFRDGDLSNIHPEDIAKVKEGFRKITVGEQRNLDIDFRFFIPDSADDVPEIKWVQCRASLIEYLGGEAILVNKLDVTRTKELEFLLRTEDKMASLGRVASGIAHEIRNPLSGINIYLSNLEKIIDEGQSARKTKAKEIIDQLQSASNRIESVIRRVMDFSKPREPRFLLININHPITNAVNFSSVMLRRGGVAVNTFLAENLPLCYADPHLLEQVILNLITNAKEAMKQLTSKKTITITSSSQEEWIVLTVSDSGPGVPRYMKKRIFDAFYTTKDGNTGIGLSLCHRIIVDHGGILTVSDSDQGGAVFRIELPLKREQRKISG